MDVFAICDNCEARTVVEDLDPVRNWYVRVDPESEEPAGQCPECGALAYYES